VNYESRNNIFGNHQIRSLFRIFFFLGLLLAIIRLENLLYTTEDNDCYPILVNNELVISEQPSETLILIDTYNNYINYHESLISHDYGTSILHSYKVATYSYSCMLSVKFKTLISKPVGNSTIISILQNSNIWHKSAEEGPTQLS